MAAAFAAAFFARYKHLTWAVRWIFISFVFTNLWIFTFPRLTFGYAMIDLWLMAIFFQRWRSTRVVKLAPLVIIQGAFMALHVAGALMDFAGPFLGAERTHIWIESFWRNRLFELSNAYIIAVSGLYLAIRYSRHVRAALMRHRRNAMDTRPAVGHKKLTTKIAIRDGDSAAGGPP